MVIPRFQFNTKVKIFLSIQLLFFLLVKPISGIVPNFDIIDTPTAATLPKASYHLSLWAYGNGGLLSKAIMGLTDNIFLGVSFDVENAVGSGDIGFNVPGVAARFKLTDGWKNFPLLVSVGYDFFYTGVNEKLRDPNRNPLMRNIYGSYLSFSKPVFMFGAEQHFSWGIRVPMQPDYEPNNSEFFVSFDFPMGNIMPMIELEKVFFDKNRFDEVLINLGLRLLASDNISIEFNFFFNKNEPVNRMVVFEYMDNF